MKINKNILIFCTLFIMLISSVLAVSQDTFFYSGDGMSEINLDSEINLSAIDNVYSGFFASDNEYPTVCDSLGNGINQYYSFSNHEIKVHEFVDGVLSETVNLELDSSSYDILDIACVSAITDSASRDMLVVIYDDTTEIQIDGYALATISGTVLLQKISDIATFPSHVPETEIHCSEWNTIISSVDSPDYFCAYGGTDNKIYTFSSTEEEHVITVSDIDIFDDTNFGVSGKPSNVITSYDSTYEIIVTNMSYSKDGSYILSLDFDSCSDGVQACSLTSGDYSSYQVQVDNYNVNYVSTNVLSSVGGEPVQSSATSLNGKILYSKNSIIFIEKETNANGEGTNYFTKILNGVEGVRIDVGLYSALNTAGTHPTGSTIPIVKLDLDNDGVNEYCTDGAFVGKIGTWVELGLNTFSCLEIDSSGNTELTLDFDHHTGSASTEPTFIVGGYNDGDEQILILFDDENNVYETLDVSENIATFSDLSLTGVGGTYIVDSNVNGYPEFIHMSDLGMKIYYETVIDPDTILKDSNLDYDGLYGFYNPAQVNVTQSIKAKECGVALTDCTYSNENEQITVKEKLCTTCGGTVSEVCGSWSFTNPTVECTFDTVGTYNVTVNMYTTTNSETLAQTFNIPNWVVNTDNQTALTLVSEQDIISFDEVASDGTTATTTADETSVDGLGGVFATLQNNIKSIFAIIIIIGIIGSLAANGVRNPIVLMFVAILLSILMVTLGMLSGDILVYILISAVIILVLGMTLFKPQSGD